MIIVDTRYGGKKSRGLLEAELDLYTYLCGDWLSIEIGGFIFPIPDGIDCGLAKIRRSSGGARSNHFSGGIDIGCHNDVTLDVALLRQLRIRGSRGGNQFRLACCYC